MKDKNILPTEFTSDEAYKIFNDVKHVLFNPENIPVFYSYENRWLMDLSPKQKYALYINPDDDNQVVINHFMDYRDKLRYDDIYGSIWYVKENKNVIFFEQCREPDGDDWWGDRKPVEVVNSLFDLGYVYYLLREIKNRRENSFHISQLTMTSSDFVIGDGYMSPRAFYDTLGDSYKYQEIKNGRRQKILL